ncbi:methyl-accepting chemotaxis protein [sulfur-oxidizing endosymbiont of Gigantopelta aegis]|uniref:methyl-accepting chemotaxis protein n=1 Tax=sulfur-oxidizing endosymbiont of Gigantopelta aegis TaxID=2794934 RepID=UPI0018DC17CD|nr:PAS domain-containing methyl-accepting chemotaxis protein [sulfur-oxidizing endosymbiont of Gigantopelta aegis]
MPVTSTEVEVDSTKNLISTTNAKGIITSANQDFINISGYSLEELLNKNHNILRHPDMPAAAFEDLWQTIKQGKSWMGIVKNRCKNGDFYWVRAIVTPITKNGRVVEYQSVRTKARQEDIHRAERAYRLLNENKMPIELKLAKLSINLKLMSVFMLALLPLLFLASANNIIPLLITGLVSFIVAYSGIWFVTKKLKASIKQVSATVDNDLLEYICTGNCSDTNKLAFAIEMQKCQLNAVSGRLSDGSKQLQNEAKGLTSNIALTDQGVTHQHTETTQLISTMNEVIVNTSQVTANTQLASDAADDANRSVISGQEIVNNTIQTINQLAEHVLQSSNVISKLEDDSNKISTILDVIKGIAEQTNLLALNAAIEAARAGEQGRGFAVVADEVRTLASRTHDSTQEIEAMIENLQSGAKNAVEVMNQSCQQAEKGVDQARKAGEALIEISNAIAKIQVTTLQIASAAEQQVILSNSANDTLSDISDVSELTVETLESSRNISEELSKLSTMLFDLSVQFREPI